MNNELPTVAKAGYCKNCGLVHTTHSTGELSKPEKKPCKDNQDIEIELVRRTDVTQLIQERIEEEKLNCVTRTGQHAYALEVLEELLEEVQE